MFLRGHIFQTVWWILFIHVVGMMIDSGPKFYSAITPAQAHGLKVLRAHIFQTIYDRFGSYFEW